MTSEQAPTAGIEAALWVVETKRQWTAWFGQIGAKRDAALHKDAKIKPYYSNETIEILRDQIAALTEALRQRDVEIAFLVGDLAEIMEETASTHSEVDAVVFSEILRKLKSRLDAGSRARLAQTPEDSARA